MNRRMDTRLIVDVEEDAVPIEYNFRSVSLAGELIGISLYLTIACKSRSEIDMS
jgi:hypothetical protein